MVWIEKQTKLHTTLVIFIFHLKLVKVTKHQQNKRITPVILCFVFTVRVMHRNVITYTTAENSQNSSDLPPWSDI